jgi:prophage regulatory protein
MPEQIQSPPTILRRKQVEARVGLRRTTIYQRVADGTFPAPVNLPIPKRRHTGRKR